MITEAERRADLEFRIASLRHIGHQAVDSCSQIGRLPHLCRPAAGNHFDGVCCRWVHAQLCDLADTLEVLDAEGRWTR